MLLFVQILIILILACTLISIYLDEIRYAKQSAPHALMEEVWLGEERRKSVRLKTSMDMTYSYGTADARSNKTYTEDISIGGAKIQLEEKLNKGFSLILEIRLKDSAKTISANAEVIWVDEAPRILASGRRGFGTGVKFTDLKPADKKELSDFIKETLSLK